MLKQSYKPGVEYLTKVLNLSLSNLIVPEVLKMAGEIPFLKPILDYGKSYKGVFLLSSVAKTLGELHLHSLTQHFHLASHQYEFRQQHSATTALNDIIKQVSHGLNHSCPCERMV